MTTTTSPPFASHMAPNNAVHAVSGVVRHQYGETGYSIAGPVGSFSHGESYDQAHYYVFAVRAADGSEFYLAADRYERVCEAAWNVDEFVKVATL